MDTMKTINENDFGSFTDLVNALKPEDKDLNVPVGYRELVDDWGDRDSWLVSKVKSISPEEAGRTETFDGDEGEFILQLKTILSDASHWYLDQCHIDNLFDLNFDLHLANTIKELEEKYGGKNRSNIAEPNSDSNVITSDNEESK